MDIKLDDLKSKHIADLLKQHHREMLRHSPPESVHALDQASLHAPELTFWSAWIDQEFVGCGALKEIDTTHCEIKSMRTRRAYRRQGVAAKILERLLIEAKIRHYSRVSLETGSIDAFIAARCLYRKYGFECCAPFAAYVEDSNSVWMTRKLSTKALNSACRWLGEPPMSAAILPP